jgi:hypothetical protein
MENLSLNIQDYIRFAFSGGWFLLSTIILNYKNINIPQDIGSISFGISILLFCMLIGTLIYSIHRSILFPNLYKVMQILFSIEKKIVFDNKSILPFFPSNQEKQFDIRRWKSRKNENSNIGKLTEWSSQIHFLYCTTWSLFISLKISKLMFTNLQNEKM